MYFRKIINDPIYGFITINDELIAQIIAHPFYQRLRRINQMALAYLVYPGAVHTRLHHSLGAYHLMCNALNELKNKGVEITYVEEQAAKIAILLHDIGHGPFSHALENVLIENMHHETMSLLIMHEMNKEFNGKLNLAIEIFKGIHPKLFLHQLISGQLDVDRMDYLTRDSFFTGVSEGVIGYDRILKMLTVHNGELMIEEKGIYSIEKFLLSRRLMYWQVYLHKAVLSAEQMLQKIIKRAKQINAIATKPLYKIITEKNTTLTIKEFCDLDDYDIVAAIKTWCNSSDIVLSTLCNGILNRHLFKVKFYTTPINENELIEKQKQASIKYNISIEEAKYLVFTGEASSSTYNFENEHIHILFKDNTVKDISEVDNALINQNLKGKIKKYYICFIR